MMLKRRTSQLTILGLTPVLLVAFAAAVGPASAAPARPTAVALTPRSGSPDGGDPLTLRGSGLANATEVLFGGVASKAITLKSAEYLRVRTPKHAAGTVPVQVVTPAGTSAVTTGASYTFAEAPTALQWSAAATVDPSSGSTAVKSVSCVSATFCMAVNDNHVVRFDGRTWGPPVELTGSQFRAISSVSCASTTLCVAVGANPSRGAAYLYNGRSWTTAPAQKSTGTLDAVSCAPATTYCLAVGSGSLVYDNGTWTTVKLDRYPGYSVAVSCVSRTFCMFGVDDSYRIYDAQTGSLSKAQTVRVLKDSAQLSCVSSTDCVTTGNADRYSRFDGKSWSKPATIAKSFTPVGVSCVAATYCIAVDSSDAHLTKRFNGKTWGAAPTVNDPNSTLGAVSCWAGARCAAIDQVGDAYLRTGGNWSRPSHALPYTGSLTDVSCSSVTSCTAVDTTGNALQYNGTSWTTPTAIAKDNPLVSVSCVSSTFCVAVDGYLPGPLNGGYLFSGREVLATSARGHAFVYNGKSWKSSAVIDSKAWISDVSCASTRFCVAVDHRGNELTYNGTKWSAPKLIDSHGALSAVSCPTATYCVAVSEKAYITYWNGKTWTTPRHVSGRNFLSDVSCADATYCAISDFDGVEVRNGTILGHDLPGFDEDEVYASVTCASATYCLAGTQNGDDDEPSLGGETYAFNGSAQRRARVTVTNAKLDCVTASFCVGVEADGDVAAVGRG